jgi:putative flavoprotein involved in K+ transport
MNERAEMSAMAGGTERVQTLIIGGGQTGLAAGYHLAKRGMPFLILDADERIGDHWRERWDSLRLFSPARWDALPGLPFPAPAWSYPTARQMGDYLESYATHFQLPVRSGVRVDSARAAGEGRDGFVVTARGRNFEADQVIVATGPFHRPHVPEAAIQLSPDIRQLHGHEYRNPSQLQDGPVLVVGVSHSGADIAFETARTHRTMLSGRIHGQLPFAVIDTKWRSRLFLPIVGLVQRHLLTLRTPMGRAMAPHVRMGGGPLLRVRRPDLEKAGVEMHEARTVGARDGKPELDDGTLLDVANVIWCTGYRPDYSWIEPPVVGEDGWPAQERGVASTPGLYFLGIPFQYSFTSMLVNGAGRDSKYVVDRIAERVGATAKTAGVPAAVAG